MDGSVLLRAQKAAWLSGAEYRLWSFSVATLMAGFWTVNKYEVQQRVIEKAGCWQNTYNPYNFNNFELAGR